MTKNALVIYHPNNDFAEVQTKAVLFDKKYKFDKTPDDAPANLISMETSIRKIPGIKKVEIGKHNIGIERFQVFEWDEIIPHVIAAVERALSITIHFETDDKRNRR